MTVMEGPLRRRDYKRAIAFAIQGMHFDRYMGSRVVLRLYGRYFWYSELCRASRCVAAYDGDRLAGVLLADMEGEPKPFQSWGKRAYVAAFDFIQRTFYKDGAGAYDATNAEMFRTFSAQYRADGELCFLAADPDRQARGTGTLLLRELERLERGKRIFLYTDSNCAYQFYERRGFQRVCEREITMRFGDVGEVPLTCYLYSKKCGQEECYALQG